MPVPHHPVFTGRMPFLPPNQQCQSIERVLASPSACYYKLILMSSKIEAVVSKMILLVVFVCQAKYLRLPVFILSPLAN